MYQLSTNDTVIKGGSLRIPNDPLNTDYAKYLSWLDAGGVPDPYVEPALVVPSSTSKLGLIRAFKEQGAWASVKAMIAADDDVQEEWDAATEIRRADPITQGMIAAMHLTDEQVDALLIRANELVA